MELNVLSHLRMLEHRKKEIPDSFIMCQDKIFTSLQLQQIHIKKKKNNP